MYSEITKELFKRITSGCKTFSSTYAKSTSRKSFVVDGVKVVALTNYCSNITQYYIQDINS